MSPSSAAAHQWAVVAPTLPAPMMLIFARFMGYSPGFSVHGATGQATENNAELYLNFRRAAIGGRIKGR